jgi:hypothetical protein
LGQEKMVGSLYPILSFLNIIVMNTKFENLKNRFIEIYSTLLESYENDIENGIEEGIYKAEDNTETRAFIAEAKKVKEDFEKYSPSIYIYIEGGLIQGVSATEDISINKFDKDDWDLDEESQEMTPDQWEEMIQEKENNLEIKGVY